VHVSGLPTFINNHFHPNNPSFTHVSNCYGHEEVSPPQWIKRVHWLACTVFVFLSLSSDFLILPGFIDFKADEVVSINPTLMHESVWSQSLGSRQGTLVFIVSGTLHFQKVTAWLRGSRGEPTLLPASQIILVACSQMCYGREMWA